MQFHLVFSFPNFIPACPDNVSVFLPGYPSLLPPCVYFLFMFEFGQELLVHQCRPLGIFTWLLMYWDGAFWSLDKMILESSFLGQGPLGPYPKALFQAVIWRKQNLVSWSSGLWAYFSSSSLSSGYWTPPFHHHCSQGIALTFTSPMRPSFLVGMSAHCFL